MSVSFTLFSFSPMAGSPFLNIRPVHQASPAKTRDTPLPTAHVPERRSIEAHFVNASMAPTPK